MQKIIFGTTNRRKIEYLNEIIKHCHFPAKILTLQDIGWDLGEIEETGRSLSENSLIKAHAIRNFCLSHHLSYPIITDDSGLFVHSLNGKPGIRTARYADEELSTNPSLPKYECVNKLLRNLKDASNRDATYKCVVTCIRQSGTYFQVSSRSQGKIANEIVEPIQKPYFYSVFILDSAQKTFNQLSKEELKETYRYKALERTLEVLFHM